MPIAPLGRLACSVVPSRAVLTEPLASSTAPALRRRPRLAAPLLALALLSFSGAAFGQADGDKAAARQLAIQGVEALNSGRYAEALDLVTRAEHLLHAPTHMLMIGRAQIGLGQLVAARETLLKLGREELDSKAPPAFKRAQAEGKDELAAIEPRIASLKINVEGAGQKKYTVKMDDQPVSAVLVGVHRPVDPGKHEVVVYPVGQSPVKGAVELKDGEKKEIKLSIPEGPATPAAPLGRADDPDAAPAGAGTPDKTKDASPGFFTPLRGVGLGAAFVGVGGLAVGAVFMAKGGSLQSQADDAASACGKHCTLAQQKTIIGQDNDAASAKTIGVVGLIGGGVALAAGVTLIIVGKPKPKPASAFVSPWFSGNAAGLRGEF